MRTQTLMPELLDLPLLEIAKQCLAALKAQGQFSYMTGLEDPNLPRISCVYNGPNGVHCIAGLSFPEDAIVAEGHGVATVVKRNGWIALDPYAACYKRGDNHRADATLLMVNLQMVHDAAARTFHYGNRSFEDALRLELNNHQVEKIGDSDEDLVNIIKTAFREIFP